MEDANTTPAALLGGVARASTRIAPTPFETASVGKATNHDGRAATITAPNGTAQQPGTKGAQTPASKSSSHFSLPGA